MGAGHEGEQPMSTLIVTADAFPFLIKARTMIEEDSGGHLIGTVYPGEKLDFDRFEIPLDRWPLEKIQSAEAALRWVAETGGDKGIESGLYTFCNPEQSEVEKFMYENEATCAAAAPGASLETAHKLLDDYFNAWSD